MEQEILKMKRTSNAGIGRIFRALRKLKELENVGDFILYKRIILVLRNAGYGIPDKSIVWHFNNIAKDEYSAGDKRSILKDLRETGPSQKTSTGGLKDEENRL